MFKAVASSVLFVALTIAFAMGVSVAVAQSPEEWSKLTNKTATIGTKPSADGKTQVPDPDKIILCAPRFDVLAGTKGAQQCREFSKSGIIADRIAMIARHAAELANMDAMIAAIKAAL